MTEPNGIRTYLEASDDVVSEIGPIDEEGVIVPVSESGYNSIRVDEDSYDFMEEEFGLYGDEKRIPTTEIRNHFSGERPATGFHDWWLEENGIEADEDGNPYHSELIRTGEGNCAEIAITTKLWVEEMMDDVNSYIVNGRKIAENNHIAHHAYLILEDEENQNYTLMDPSTTVPYEHGSDALVAPIEGIGNEEFPEAIEFGGNWEAIQDKLGFQYTF